MLLERSQARYRQLALGRRAVLDPRNGKSLSTRTTPRCNSVTPPTRSFAILRSSAFPRHSDAPHPAGRGTVGQFQRQVARLRDCNRRRGNGLCLPRLFRATRSGRLRNADLRLPDRRRQSVPARRYGRSSLAGGGYKAFSIFLGTRYRCHFPNYVAGSDAPCRRSVRACMASAQFRPSTPEAHRIRQRLITGGSTAEC